MFIVVFLMTSTAMFAFQTDVGNPTTWMELFNQFFGEYFASVGGFSAGVIALSALLFEYMLKGKITNKTHKRLITMAIALIIGVGGHFLGLGVFGGMSLSAVIWVAIQTSFGANGLFSFIKDLFKSKKSGETEIEKT